MNLKEKILEMVIKKPLTVKEICVQLQPNYDKHFLKKVHFHCQDLWNKNRISRVSSPYQYSLDGAARNKSLYDHIWEILQSQALFYSEINMILQKKKVFVKQSTLSNVLSRLRHKKLIVSSKTQLGNGQRHNGYIWSMDRALIRQKFRDELPQKIACLLHHTIIPLSLFSEITGLDKQRSLRMMKRISIELDIFVLEKNVLRRCEAKSLKIVE